MTFFGNKFASLKAELAQFLRLLLRVLVLALVLEFLSRVDLAFLSRVDCLQQYMEQKISLNLEPEATRMMKLPQKLK